MTIEYGLTDKGFVKKPYSVILDEICADYETAFPGFRRHESNALYIQAQSAANREERYWNTIEAVFYSKYVITATGYGLELRVADTIGSRRGDQYATGEIWITNHNGNINNPVVLPLGTLLNRTDGLVQYRTTRVANLTSPEDKVPIIATTAGPVGNTSSYTIMSFATTPTDPNLANAYIFNQDSVIGGRGPETDDELKERYYSSLQDSRGSNIPAISAALRKTSATTYTLYENRTNDWKIVPGIGDMPAHSIAAVVMGGSDEEIAEALFKTKAGGIDMIGSTSVTATDVDGAEYEMLFTRAQGESLYSRVEVFVDYQYLSSYTDIIRTQMADYINKLGINEVMQYNVLIAKGFDGIKGVTSLNLYIDNNIQYPRGTSNITPMPGYKFSILESDIKIITSTGTNGARSTEG